MPFESEKNPSFEYEPDKAWQLALRRFFHQAWVEISIGVLVLLSVLLTLGEFWLEFEFESGLDAVPTFFGLIRRHHLTWMVIANEIITLVFVIELTARYFAASSKRAYFREFWLDIIATFPLFRVFRFGRAFRLLRLVRLFRLMGVISRLSGHYPTMLHRGAVDFLMICGLLALTVLFGTLAILHFETKAKRVERGAQQAETNLSEPVLPLASTTSSEGVYTLFAGEPVPAAPKTVSGKIVTVFLMFMGLTIFAIFAGTVSAFMVDRMRVEGRIVEWDALQNHIVICGWTPKTRIIIDEYRASAKTRKTPIVVITELDREELDDDCSDLASVYFVHDDFTKVTVLERAGIRNAKTCLVLTDTSGGRSEQDADARTILASLTVEKINESVYTCAELVNRSYATHLETGKVNDFVVSGEYGAHMLAQAAMNKGLISVLSELLTYQHGNEFYRQEIPKTWIGTSFDSKLSEVKQNGGIILVAVHSMGQEAVVNPQNYEFREGDEVVVISNGAPKLS